MEKDVLESLIAQNMSQREIAKILDVSQTKIRYWLISYGLKTLPKHTKTLINSVSKYELMQIVASSCAYHEVLAKLGVPRQQGAYYRSLHKRLSSDNISTEHFTMGKTQREKISIESSDSHFVEDSILYGSTLRKSILKFELVEYVCAVCKQEPIWQDSLLTLQLDHINGIKNDNRLANLRFLCPNCHTQTDTYGSKNKTRYYYPDHRDKPKVEKLPYVHPTKIEWPSKEELEKLIWSGPRSELALELGVSDVAIAKRCRKLGIPQPQRGYWQRVREEQKLARH